MYATEIKRLIRLAEALPPRVGTVLLPKMTLKAFHVVMTRLELRALTKLYGTHQLDWAPFEGLTALANLFRFLACSNAYDVCNLGELIPIQSSGINLYDVTKPCTGEPHSHSYQICRSRVPTVKPLCYDFSAPTKWLNDANNIKAIGAKKSSWASCNRAVEVKLVFAGDWMLSFAEAIKGLLEAKIPVIILCFSHKVH